MQAAGLPGDALELIVKPNRVALQLGDVGVTIQGVEAARRVPGGAGGELLTLQQHDVLPARLSQVVKHAAADDAAADYDNSGMGLHEGFLYIFNMLVIRLNVTGRFGAECIAAHWPRGIHQGLPQCLRVGA